MSLANSDEFVVGTIGRNTTLLKAKEAISSSAVTGNMVRNILVTNKPSMDEAPYRFPSSPFRGNVPHTRISISSRTVDPVSGSIPRPVSDGQPTRERTRVFSTALMLRRKADN